MAEQSSVKTCNDISPDRKARIRWMQVEQAVVKPQQSSLTFELQPINVIVEIRENALIADKGKAILYINPEDVTQILKTIPNGVTIRQW